MVKEIVELDYYNNYLKKIFPNIELLSSNYKDDSGWKHGFPKSTSNNNETLFIFIIRDLEPWLKSMYNRPYHLKKHDNIDLFITDDLIANDKRKDHDVNINKEETGKSLLQLRCDKINRYIEFFKTIQHGIMINLEDIQKDYGEKFINTIKKEFMLSNDSNDSTFIKITRHTKTGENKQSIIHNTTIDQTIIERYLLKNESETINIEEFVNNLKSSYLITNNLTSQS